MLVNSVGIDPDNEFSSITEEERRNRKHYLRLVFNVLEYLK